MAPTDTAATAAAPQRWERLVRLKALTASTLNNNAVVVMGSAGHSIERRITGIRNTNANQAKASHARRLAAITHAAAAIMIWAIAVMKSRARAGCTCGINDHFICS